ncbi:hypothetical protein COV24_02625, partial [candidate division WWE3 bacterium CG10_big_fil_rev_8_21_14_0_10_32_10]
MSGSSKKEYINHLRRRYRLCKRRIERSKIVEELVKNLRIHRKSAIRTLNFKPKKYRGRKERKITYGFDLITPLKQIWLVAGRPCSKRLKPQIPEILRKMKQFNEINLYEGQEKLLCKMSTFTIDNLLIEERISKVDKGLSGTKSSPLLKQLIPVRTTFDEINEPGHIEMDCVLHCGESISGSYAETLNLLDIETHWNEKDIFLNKTNVKVIGSLHKLRKQFPFKVKSLDFDNGYEFVNWAMYKYCDREKLSYTRSRSYRKNDQAHIEGKNNQSVRKVVGYDRITDSEIVNLIQNIYQEEHRQLTNFFYTTLKLKEKTRIRGKVTKKYGIAKTPYQRVLESSKVSAEVKETLTREYER